MLKYPIFYFSEKFRITLNKETDPLFIMFDYSLRSPAVSMKEPHRHDFCEILIPLEKGNAHLIEGKYYKLAPNDIVLLKQGINHMSIYEKTKETKISSRILINFNLFSDIPSFRPQIERLLSPFEAKIPIFRFPPDIMAIIIRKLNDIFVCGKERRNGWEIEYYALFLEFLRIIYTSEGRNVYTEKKKDMTIEERIYTVCSFIQKYSNEELPLRYVADEFAISTDYLSREMKKITGMSFIEYLQTIRTRNAMIRLTFQPGNLIKDVLLDAGFSSVAQANRVFRSIAGMSPSRFKDISREEKIRIIERIDPDKGEETEGVAPIRS